MNDLRWTDKFAIQELIYSHCDAITRGDLRALESLNAPDAIWEIPLFGLRIESARAFFDFLAEATATADLLLQTAHDPVGATPRRERGASYDNDFRTRPRSRARR